MLAALFALMGALAAGAPPLARRWARKEGHTGSLAGLVRKAASTRREAPKEAQVHHFAPPPKPQPPEPPTPAEVVFTVAVPKGTTTAVFRKLETA